MKISNLVMIIVGFFLFALGLILFGIETYRLHAVGMLLVGLFILLFFGRHIDLKEMINKRSSKSIARKVILSVLVFGIVVMLNYISYQHYYQVDITKNKRFSLSSQTKKVLKQFKGKLRFVLFEKKGSLVQEDAKTLFRQYAYLKPSIKIRHLDVDQNPDVAKKYGVKIQGTLVILSGKRTQKVESVTERGITNALLKLTQNNVKNIYFVEGHGERGLDVTERDGFKEVRKALEEQTYKVKKFNFFERPSVPIDCSVLVIAGPQKEYLPEEIQAIDDYLNRGGRCLFMLDPHAGAFSKYLNDNWGIIPGDDIIVDRMGKLMGGNELSPVVMAYGDHDITRDFRYYTFFPLSRSITIKSKDDVKYFSLAVTTPASWAETDYKKDTYEYTEGKDIKGPVSLVLAAKKTVLLGDNNKSQKGKTLPKEAEIVVVGDSDFATNTNISVSQMGNKDFLLNIISWLSDQGELISIRPRENLVGELTVTADQAALVWLIVIIILPSVWIIKGVVEWVKRRRM